MANVGTIEVPTGGCGREVNGMVCSSTWRCDDCAAHDPTAALTAFRAVEALGRRYDALLKERDDLKARLTVLERPTSRQKFSTVACPFGCGWSSTYRDFMPPHDEQHYVIPATERDAIAVVATVNGLVSEVLVRVERWRDGKPIGDGLILYQRHHACTKIVR